MQTTSVKAGKVSISCEEQTTFYTRLPTSVVGCVAHGAKAEREKMRYIPVVSGTENSLGQQVWLVSEAVSVLPVGYPALDWQ